MIDTLCRRLALQDLETWCHSGRVRVYAVRMARELGLDAETTRSIALGATLHDIGKLCVPRFLLNKTTGLSAAEYAIVSRHTVLGEELLRQLIDNAAILDIVRSHHERVDGRGLPDALSRSRIPLGARIVAVADAFDAMVSARPYHPPIAPSLALAELQGCVGTQFDGKCVAALAAALRQATQAHNVVLSFA